MDINIIKYSPLELSWIYYKNHETFISESQFLPKGHSEKQGIRIQEGGYPILCIFIDKLNINSTT